MRRLPIEMFLPLMPVEGVNPKQTGCFLQSLFSALGVDKLEHVSVTINLGSDAHVCITSFCSFFGKQWILCHLKSTS